MLNPASPLARLIEAPVLPGSIAWIGVRPQRRMPVDVVEMAVLDPDEGIHGDHYASRTGGHRHVTLLQREHLDAIGSFLGRAAVDPAELRRNVVVAGLNLLALKGKSFRLGAAELAWTGECHPCSRMEEILGPGGYNAVRGHGGITARVLKGGTIRLGETVLPLPAA